MKTKQSTSTLKSSWAYILMVPITCLFSPLNASSAALSQPTEEAIPDAPALPEEKVDKAAKKNVATVPMATQAALEIKEGKQATRELVTRNLILFFNEGNDNGACIYSLSIALAEQWAYLIIHPGLWELLNVWPSYLGVKINNDNQKALDKITYHKTCAGLFFNPNQWDTYKIKTDKQRDEKGAEPIFYYLFVPHRYKNAILGEDTALSTDQQEQKLGLNLQALESVTLTPTINEDCSKRYTPWNLPMVTTTFSKQYTSAAAITEVLSKALIESRKAFTSIHKKREADIKKIASSATQSEETATLKVWGKGETKAIAPWVAYSWNVYSLGHGYFTEKLNSIKKIIQQTQKALANHPQKAIIERLVRSFPENISQDTLNDQLKGLAIVLSSDEKAFDEAYANFNQQNPLLSKIVARYIPSPQIQPTETKDATAHTPSPLKIQAPLNILKIALEIAQKKVELEQMYEAVDKEDGSGGRIIDIPIPAFQALTKFLNDAVYTNVFYYSSCFSGGDHLITPFLTIFGVPQTLNYPIISQSLLYIEGYGENMPVFDYKRPISSAAFITPLTNINPTIFPSSSSGWFTTPTNFEQFFNNFDVFAQGKLIKLNTGVVRGIKGSHTIGKGKPSAYDTITTTCNYLGRFLDQDQTHIEKIRNTAQIRFPGTTWFALTDLGTVNQVIPITRANVIAKNIDLKQTSNESNYLFNVAGNKLVFLLTKHIAVPLFMDNTTTIVPIVNAFQVLLSPPFEPTNEFATIGHPSVFLFDEITSNDTLMHLIKCLRNPNLNIEDAAAGTFAPTLASLNNVVFLVQTMIGLNDFDLEDIPDKTPILHDVMLFIRSPNPLAPDKHNTVIFRDETENYYVIEDDGKPTIIKDPNQAQRCSNLYKQLKNSCLDEHIKPYQPTQEALGKRWQAKRDLLQKKLANSIKQALIHLVSSDAVERKKAIDFCNSLFKRGQGFEDAYIAVEKAFTSSDNGIKASALSLLEDLVFHNSVYLDQALPLALKGLSTADDNVQVAALNLFNRFIANNKFISEATNAIQQALVLESPSVNTAGLKVLETLLICDKINTNELPQYLTSMDRYLLSPNIKLRQTAQELLKSFFTRNIGFDQAVKIAEDGEKTSAQASNELWELLATWASSSLTSDSARDLLVTLVNKSHGFAQALEIAVKDFAPGLAEKREAAFKLLKALIEKNYELKIILNLASKDFSGFPNDDYALELIKALIEKNYGIREIIELAAPKITSAFSETSNAALALFQALFDKDKGIDAAKQYVSKMRNAENRRKLKEMIRAYEEKHQDVEQKAAKTVEKKVEAPVVEATE